MKNKSKKLLCLLLSLCLVFSLLPVMAAADGESDRVYSGDYESLSDAVADAISKDKILELTQNYELSKPLSISVPVGQTLRIEGNGKEIAPDGIIVNSETSADQDTAKALINLNANLDGNNSGGVLELVGLRLNCYVDASNYAGKAINCKNTDLTLENVEIYGVHSNVYGVRFDSSCGDKNLRVRDSKIFEDFSAAGTANAIGIQLPNPDTHTSLYGSTKLNIIAKHANTKITIYGGEYGFNPSSYVPNNGLYSVEQDEENNIWRVGPSESAVALVNGKCYATLGDTFNAVDTAGGGSVQIYKPASVTGVRSISLSQPLSIFGNGNTITFEGESYLIISGAQELEWNDSVIEATSDNPLRLNLNGDHMYRLNNVTCTSVQATGANTEFNSCNFTAVDLSGNNTSPTNYYFNESVCGSITTGIDKLNLNVDYCTVEQLTVTNAPNSCICIGPGEYGFNPTALVDGNQYGINTNQGGDRWFVYVKEDAAVAKIVFNEYVEYFTDLDRAVGHAKNGDTVELIAPEEGKRQIVLDHCLRINNGNTFTIKGYQSRTMLITPWDSNFNDEGTGAMIYVDGNTHVTLDGVAVVGLYNCDFCVSIEDRGGSLVTSKDSVFLYSRDISVFASEYEYEGNESYKNLLIESGYFEHMYGSERSLYNFFAEDVGTEDWFEEDNVFGNYYYNNETSQYAPIAEEQLPTFEGTRYLKLTFATPSYIAVEGADYAAPLGTYTVTLKLHNTCGVAGMALKLDYDEIKFFQPSVAFGNNFKNVVENIPTYLTKGDEGYVTFGWLQDDNLATGEYEFATLTFTVKDDIAETGFDMTLSINEAANPGFTYKNSCKVNDLGDVVAVKLITGSFSGETRYLPGDVDGDMDVTIADVQYLLKYIVGYGFNSNSVGERTSFTEAKFIMAGDVDGDGCITIIDAVKVLRAVSGYEDEVLL